MGKAASTNQKGSGMPGESHRQTVGDYVTLQRGTTYKGSLVGEAGPALLGLGSIEPGGGFRHGHFKTYGGDCPEELILFPGDLYVALKGATKDGKMIGSVARVPKTVPSGRLTQDTVKLKFRNSHSDDARYLYWILRTPQYRAHCAGHAMGSAVVALSRNDFLTYPVPPLTVERRQFVALLDALDEKIELNRRMNETLEALARALFKSWFVDFDPVRAKAKGRDPGLPKDLAALFPDSFEDSELGEVPKGWEARTLAAYSALNPESWSKETAPDEVEYVDLANTKWGRIEATQRYRWEDAPSRAQRVLRAGDTIVGTVRPGNGSYAFVSEDGLTGSSGFAVLRPRKPEFREFVYFAATAVENIEALAHLADGGAYPAVRPDVVIATKMVRPPDPVVFCFANATSGFLAKTAQGDRESRTLASLRDTLLPNLISVKIRMRDAEKRIGRTV